jgi:hypothetical protein
MRFDSEPEQRYLLHHAGTGTLFETYCISRAVEYLDNPGVEDVTNVPDYELRYKRQVKAIQTMLDVSK